MAMPSGPLQVVPDVDDQQAEEKNATPLLGVGTSLLCAASPLSLGETCLNCCVLTLNFTVIT